MLFSQMSYVFVLSLSVFTFPTKISSPHHFTTPLFSTLLIGFGV